ncbi:MAG TPA: helix-turn-helix domain-containing protein [Dehalococcoidia bacterium]|nr:helix-turn-helix domain-containing protein [Dehalococcoidia bacterium]
MADRELRLEEVLERLPVPRETLIRWLQDKELKGRRIAERKGGWRVRGSDLESFIHVRRLDTPERRP